ncbi:hypothetical protein BKA56DRAFT_571790 [Ilyonectria sp. MPI-CAGE-AT-0026]|nr:hypothetical protein BKA56DRAFT_571790 [Ilyonectria sp. MPI-CAGE-AT-0026]
MPPPTAQPTSPTEVAPTSPDQPAQLPSPVGPGHSTSSRMSESQVSAYQRRAGTPPSWCRMHLTEYQPLNGP